MDTMEQLIFTRWLFYVGAAQLVPCITGMPLDPLNGTLASVRGRRLLYTTFVARIFLGQLHCRLTYACCTSTQMRCQAPRQVVLAAPTPV